MVLAFWMGTKTQSGPPEVVVAGAPRAIPVEPIVYTPERGVKADWFASDEGIGHGDCIERADGDSGCNGFFEHGIPA